MGNKKVIGVAVYILMLGFLLWLGYTIVYGKGGIVERRRTERTLACLQTEIEALKHDIEMADKELSNLATSEKYTMQLARELGYKKDGETIFRFLRKKESSLD